MSGWGSIIPAQTGGGGATGEVISLGLTQTPGDTATSDPSIESFGEATAVASGVETTILSYVVSGVFHLVRIEVSGTNIASYSVYYDGVRSNKLITYFGGSLSGVMDYSNGQAGIQVPTGTIITIKVLHNRPDVGDFTARLQGKIIN